MSIDTAEERGHSVMCGLTSGKNDETLEGGRKYRISTTKPKTRMSERLFLSSMFCPFALLLPTSFHAWTDQMLEMLIPLRFSVQCLLSAFRALLTRLGRKEFKQV